MFYDDPFRSIASAKKSMNTTDNSPKIDRELQKQEEDDRVFEKRISNLIKTVGNPRSPRPANDLDSSPKELKDPVDYAEAKDLLRYIVKSRFFKSLTRSILVYYAAIVVLFVVSIVLFRCCLDEHWVWASIFMCVAVVLGTCYLIQGLGRVISHLRFTRLLKNGEAESKFSSEEIIRLSLTAVDKNNQFEKDRAEKEVTRKHAD